MLPSKTFENLRTLIAILVLFEQFLRQILFKVFAPNSQCLNKHDAFCSRIFDLLLLSGMFIVIEEKGLLLVIEKYSPRL